MNVALYTRVLLSQSIFYWFEDRENEFIGACFHLALISKLTMFTYYIIIMFHQILNEIF